MEKEKKKKNSKQPKFSKKAEGEEALTNLINTLAKEGVLIRKEEKDLLYRIKILENEVNLLRDLFVRVLQVDKTVDKTKSTLQD